MPSSLRPLFEPRTVAVIGASRTPGTIGWQIIDNLIRHGYQGAVYPVNPEARAVHSIPAWRSVREIPVDVDLAVIVVPRDRVLRVVDECGAKGVPAVIVISSGFREAGPEGARREAELVARVRRYGMRLVGPNCMGVVNTDRDVSMNATFAPRMPPPGPVSFLSQSGALGVTVLDYAAEYGIGIRHFVSVGNKPDVSGNDLLEYWERDPETRVVLMYLETFGNPRRFTRIARRVARRKPIVVVKSGRRTRGARPARSLTGALASEDAAVDALLAQCGVHRADTVEELFDLAMTFRGLPIPRSDRVAILTNAGGPGSIIADACADRGMTLVTLSPETRTALAQIAGDEADLGNPVHLPATTTPGAYREALETVLSDASVDAVIAAFVPPLGARQQEIAQSIVQATSAHPGTPVLAVLMGKDGLPEGRAELQAAGVPAYIFPESAARALAALQHQARWLERPVQAPVSFPVDPECVRSILDRAKDRGGSVLEPAESREILGAYGIRAAPYRKVHSLEEARSAAAELGFPVLLAAISSGSGAKGAACGLQLDLRDPEQLALGYGKLEAELPDEDGEGAAEGYLVISSTREGLELILGLTTDPTFGPVLMFGMGGPHVETFRDVAFRIPPLTEVEAREMIRSIRSHAILDDPGRSDPIPTGRLVEALQRFSQLVQEHPAIEEIDVHPLLATSQGILAGDVRIRLGSPSSDAFRRTTNRGD